MAYVVMALYSHAYIVMAYIVMAPYSHGLYSHGALDHREVVGAREHRAILQPQLVHTSRVLLQQHLHPAAIARRIRSVGTNGVLALRECWH